MFQKNLNFLSLLRSNILITINGFYDDIKYNKNYYDIIRFSKNNNTINPLIILDISFLKKSTKFQQKYIDKIEKKV